MAAGSRSAFVRKLVDRMALTERCSPVCAYGAGTFIWASANADAEAAAEALEPLSALLRQPIGIDGREYLPMFGLSLRHAFTVDPEDRGRARPPDAIPEILDFLLQGRVGPRRVEQAVKLTVSL